MGTEPGFTLRWPAPGLSDEALASLIGPGAPFELVDDTIRGARLRVFANRPRALHETLLHASERFGDRRYLVFHDRELTYSSIVPAVASVARALQEEFGVEKGDRVAVASASCAPYMITFWATVSIGAVFTGLNGWWTGPEMEHAIALTRPKVILGDRRRLERLAESDLGTTPVVVFEDGFDRLEAYDAAPGIPEVDVDEDDPCLILFTSGTTGRSKGAVLTHRNHIHFGHAMMLGGAESFVRDPPATAAPVLDAGCVISAAPLFHTSGLHGQTVAGVFSGLTTVFPPPGRWREDVHLELTVRYGANSWALVPTQLWRLLEWPELDRYDLSKLVRVGGGGAVWPPELLRRLQERLPGVQRNIGYGSTETTATGTLLKGAATFEHPDSVGQPGATVELQVRQPGTDRVLPEGEIGEICLRSAANCAGYWEDPDATREAIDPDGWYRTGDHGSVRDGFVFLGGRRSDLIIRGGENVYPVEIENRLAEHPDIAEAAVIGSPHPTLGQEVHAFVVVHPGASLSEDDVRQWVAGTLAPFKVPATVTFRDELPHNAVGKVMKRLLEEPEAATEVSS